MLQTAPHPTNATFNVEQQMNYSNGKSKQGVAFGVIFARAEVKVNVDDRILDLNGMSSTGNFEISAISGQSIFKAETGPVALSDIQTEGIPVGTMGTQLNFASSTTDPNASSYTTAWQCSKTNPQTGITSYWPNQNQTSATAPPQNSAFNLVKAGEFLRCEVNYRPPYITLMKQVDNTTASGATNVGNDWLLTAAGTKTKFTIPGAPGTGYFKAPVAVDPAYDLSETGPGGANPWQHGYTWRDLECAVTQGSNSTPMEPNAVQITRDNQAPDVLTGAIQSANLNVVKGNDLTCTYKNQANKPNLQVKKDADPVTKTVVAAESIVEYKLTFDNTEGTAKAATDYTDYLDDVLDDADLLDSSADVTDNNPDLQVALTPSGSNWGGQVVYDKPTKSINIAGVVPAYTKLTVEFKVKVKSNDDDPLGRTSTNGPAPNANEGFALNNYLVKTGGAVPNSCNDTDTSCTSHPVRAWSVEKNSRPLEGAAVHSGANTYYRVYVTNFAKGEQISGITLKDDMTSALFAGIMDLNAPQAVTVPWGISFYNEQRQHLTAEDII
ncbi:MAG TPA: hypothetical protein VLZ31_03810 [Microbacteriaceae bacterium]|nr:hypothetical protein [Microbacteriaceae bacterium]